ncbi:universal stress protein [Pseudorhodoferax sp. Leaf267]|uniref:universal stress protein n=1 Tax=Pseudorhodoferax sp. Leaf267 TaxID=1736316 RepID=UPI0006F6CE93|nr:universal stress protein [Pseudorhodoferax sp. Leaf267]KQP22788.1 universal stress protein UspA [Pseudorhodoferax sp. Leaf267]
MYQRILVATDGSELSQKAVDSALGLAAQLGASVVAVKVVPPYPQSYFEGAMAIDLKQVAQTEEHWSAAAMRELEVVQSAGLARNVTVTPLVVRSDQVSEALIASAQKHHCDLIVMASHGRRGVSRLLLGSETQHVLTHSHIPVLVLR